MGNCCGRPYGRDPGPAPGLHSVWLGHPAGDRRRPARAIYYAASRRLTFLIEDPLVCGLFFGGAVQEVMNLVVLPLSALHSKGPYKLQDLLLGLSVHMVVIGLPVSFSVRRFGK
jgi:hypothetical protein